MSLGVLFFLLGLLLIIGIPIGMVLTFMGILPNLIDPWFAADPQYIIRAMISGVNSFPILAVPMFILSGDIMSRGKIGEKLYNLFAYFIGDRTAGMPIAVIITCLFYGAISGSGPATAAAVGSMTIPILVKLGYDEVFATSLVAVAGGLGVIIPPSIPLVFYGLSSGTSVGDLFIAGIIPGLLIGASLMLYSYYYCKKHGEDKEKINSFMKEIRKKGLLSLLKGSFWALLTPIIILGSIYSGIATPTEVAVISVFYSLIISLFIYKTLTWKDILPILKRSVGTYASVIFIIAAAIGFARVLTFMRAPDLISQFIASTVTSKVVLLLSINILLLFVGMIIDTTPGILVLTPILLPIVQSYGVDPLHFGIIMVTNLAIGFVTPPMGVNLFVASSITGVPVTDIARKTIPFIIAFIISLLLITFIPGIHGILLQ